jgi:hypothetical protein
MPIRKEDRPKRNDKCPCGSDKKFKWCCGQIPYVRPAKRIVPEFIDGGETPVRWVIVNEEGTSLFADKDNRALVFPYKELAHQIATLDEFDSQAPGEINVAGVGETKFKVLQEKVPYVEVSCFDEAAALVRERIALTMAQEPEQLPPEDIHPQENDS